MTTPHTMKNTKVVLSSDYLMGLWYKLSDRMASEKVGQALRDVLSSEYKSSTQAKRRRWKNEDEKRDQVRRKAFCNGEGT